MAYDDGFVNIPGDPVIVPGPPDDSGPSPREMAVRSLSPHRVKRLEALWAAGMDVGEVAIQLSIQSSAVAMYFSQRDQFDAIRDNVDPRNLGRGRMPTLSGGGPPTHRPGVMRGS